ncbi:MAG TPA: lmo0937 family membrane protein [Terriglobales bacterium]
MLWPIIVLLLLLWLAGVVASYTLGGYIHALLVLAVGILIAQVVTRQGENGGLAEAERAQPDNADKNEPPNDQRVA